MPTGGRISSNSVTVREAWFIALVLGILSLAVFFTECNASRVKAESVQVDEWQMNFPLFEHEAVVTTIGNHSYIKLHRNGTVDYYAPGFIYLLNDFEKNHPEFEVTGWRIESSQVVNEGTPENKIFGIWVDHKPKVKNCHLSPLKLGQDSLGFMCQIPTLINHELEHSLLPPVPTTDRELEKNH